MATSTLQNASAPYTTYTDRPGTTRYYNDEGYRVNQDDGSLQTFNISDNSDVHTQFGVKTGETTQRIDDQGRVFYGGKLGGFVQDGNITSERPAPQVSTAKASTWDAMQRQVGQNDLVENRLSGLLSQDNPYMQTARTSGLQTAAQRGLLNSSLAGEASQLAAIKSSLPIAQQDAKTYFDQGINNQNAVNLSRGQNADAATRAALANADSANRSALAQFELAGKRDLANLEQINREDLAGIQQGYDLEKLGVDYAHREDLLNIETQNKAILQSSASAATMYSQSITAIGDIMEIQELKPEDRQQAIDQQVRLLNNGLSLIGNMGGLELNIPSGGDITGVSSTAPAPPVAASVPAGADSTMPDSFMPGYTTAQREAIWNSYTVDEKQAAIANA